MGLRVMIGHTNRQTDKQRLLLYIYEYIFQAYAKDGGIPPRSSQTAVTIDVKESNNKPPSFRQVSKPPIPRKFFFHFDIQV